MALFLFPVHRYPGRSTAPERNVNWPEKESGIKKLSSDSDYKEARKEAQKRWKDKNPQYWKEYRSRNPEYTLKNRTQQGTRNLKRQGKPPGKEIAKTDESNSTKSVLTGRYKIIPIHADRFAKTDECIIEIVAISGG